MMYRLLLFFIMLNFSHAGFSNIAMDSLRIEKISGKKYVIHRVEPKETLYSIAKRYEISVEDLRKQNPSLAAGLKMYDEIQVPLTRKKKRSKPENDKSIPTNIHIVQQGETLFAISKKYGVPVDSLAALNQLENSIISIGDTLVIKSADKPQKNTQSISLLTKQHIVQPSETLFSISGLYQVEVEDLQRWNQLPDYTLSIGQKLIVSAGIAKVPGDSLIVDAVMEKKTPAPTKVEKPALDTLYVKTDNSLFKPKTKEIEGRKQTIEEGFAMKIEDTDYTKKFLALHRTAPLGSTIQVKNQMTNRVIAARVVGKLPESAMNQKLLMRLSAAAYQALGARDLKIPVTVSYQGDE